MILRIFSLRESGKPANRSKLINQILYRITLFSSRLKLVLPLLQVKKL
jgi:hypothetical protein